MLCLFVCLLHSLPTPPLSPPGKEGNLSCTRRCVGPEGSSLLGDYVSVVGHLNWIPNQCVLCGWFKAKPAFLRYLWLTSAGHWKMASPAQGITFCMHLCVDPALVFPTFLQQRPGNSGKRAVVACCLKLRGNEKHVFKTAQSPDSLILCARARKGHVGLMFALENRFSCSRQVRPQVQSQISPNWLKVAPCAIKLCVCDLDRFMQRYCSVRDDPWLFTLLPLCIITTVSFFCFINCLRRLEDVIST